MPTTPRPPLPVRHANPHVQITLNSGILPPVKYQILNCQGQDILVGRLKIETPTPTGHAFILRRFDTGSISLTTMFRAAFPNAPDHEEKSELQWVKDNYDLAGNNGGPQSPHITRLAGTWVSPALAKTLGDTYALGDLITAVIEASPDPNGNYRRSGKAAVAAQKATPVAVTEIHPTPSAIQLVKALPTPSPQDAPNPAKRRKESPPAPPALFPHPVSPPGSPSKIPLPRRSSRTRSPAPPKTFPLTSIKTPKSASRTTRREEVKVVTPSSDLTVVDEENAVIEDGAIGSELHQQDVAEQRVLIESLKAERAQQAAATKVFEEADEDKENQAGKSVPEPITLKRSREDGGETLRFNFREPEIGEREIATNKRISRFQPRTRQLAWGVAVFALGMGAAAIFPSFL